jgi:exodeoxyribonuclease-3
MKVSTFNSNSLRSRLPIILEWLAKHKPDVLCVQETKVQDPDFPAEAFADSGYEFVFKGQKKYNGVAIFSRGKIEKVELGLDDEPKDEPRLIKAVIQDIPIVNTYVPQGYAPDSEKFEYKLRWFERLGEYFARHFKPDKPLIWVGDLNIARLAEDVHDPEGLWGHVCYCAEVQERLNKIMEWGFIDLFREHCKEAGQFTFWDYRVPNGFKRNIGWRLDYIMATRPLAQKCTKCFIDTEPRQAERPSDHTFLIAEFDI